MKFSGVILYVPDVRKTLAFYERAFGLKPRFLSEDASFGDVHTGSVLLGFATVEMSRRNWKGGVRVGGPGDAPPSFEIGIETEDVAGVVKRAVDAGATVLSPAETMPWGQTVAFLRDPDGHVIDVATPWAP
jgi:catechol 2,3-dioxygenase-like lactoylglutathione lyase family enzyme